jgi:phytoene dehydrogenase-like protein
MKKVVIVGSGLGGLMAGNLLAKKGHQVTIFESHRLPGGYTAGFRRNGFYFESGTFSFEASASVFKAMKDLSIFDQVEFVPQKLRIVAPGFDAAPASLADFKNRLIAAFPGEMEPLQKFFAVVDEMVQAMGPADKPFPFLYDGLAFLWAMIAYLPLGIKSGKMFKKYDGMTAGEFVGQYFKKDSFLYRLLGGVGYPDMVAWMAGGFLSMFDEYWTVKGGMQSWADALAANFKKLGGDLKLSSPVDKILTKNGVAVGVFSTGQAFDADIVISAGDYKQTMLKLLDDPALIPAELKTKIQAAPVSEGIVTVYLGLNLTNDELRKIMKVPHVTFFDEQPGMDIHNSNDEQFFEKTSVVLYSPSLINPKLAPEGKSSLMIQAMSPSRWMHNWGDGNREQYMQLKGAAKKALINKAEKLIPSLRDRIEYQDAATPLTYERFTHNTDGATSAWSWNPKNRFYKQMMDAQVKTPVKNLYIGSCWACQLGGVPGALIAAYLCAKKIR